MPPRSRDRPTPIRRDRRTHSADGRVENTGGSSFSPFRSRSRSRSPTPDRRGASPFASTPSPSFGMPKSPFLSIPSPAYRTTSEGSAAPYYASSAPNSPTGKRHNMKARTESWYTKNLSAVHDLETLCKGKSTIDERVKIIPDDEYPDTYMNRDEMRREMNKMSAFFHDLSIAVDKTSYDGNTQIGVLRCEVLQCFGLPHPSLLTKKGTNVWREASAYCIAVCGPYAFKTDTMGPTANPVWLSRMRRACSYPIYHAYARLYLGVFDNSSEYGSFTDFIGRTVIDLARIRPHCTYDITLPLRESAYVYDREQLGSVRLRLHLEWTSGERAAVLSYIPRAIPRFRNPQETKMTINCVDDRAFRDVALVVHGVHMPGRFNLQSMKSTIREINATQIMIMRYMRKREIFNLVHYIYPFISLFVFGAWMHCVYMNTVRYVIGHFLTFILLHILKNYAYYVMYWPISNGFLPVSFEEMLGALLFGNAPSASDKNDLDGNSSHHTGGSQRKKKRKPKKVKHYIEPINMEMDELQSLAVRNPNEGEGSSHGIVEPQPQNVSLRDIAECMRRHIPVQTHKRNAKCFLGTEAVDLLVSFGFAKTREDAVELGRRMEKELTLFTHVSNKYQQFDDKPLFYSFLEYDAQKYIFRGHKPWGRTLFQMIGFLNYKRKPESLAHVPFPFATGEDHPRFTVKQSLVLRSAEARKTQKHYNNQLEEEQKQQLEKIAAMKAAKLAARQAKYHAYTKSAESTTSGGDHTTTSVTNNGGNTLPPSGSLMDEKKRPMLDDIDPTESARFFDEIEQLELQQDVESKAGVGYDKHAYDSDGDVEEVQEKTIRRVTYVEKTFKKPPSQDIKVKEEKADKPLPKAMEEVRHQIHQQLLHIFNLQTYKIDQHIFPPQIEGAANKDAAAAAPPNNGYQSDMESVVSGTSSKYTNSSNKARDEYYKKKRKFEKQQEKERKKQAAKKSSTVAPYDKRKDECDRILSLDKYTSSGNIIVNQIGVIVQPILEVAQAFLALARSLFNIFTWQDPYMTFWVVIGGFMLVLVFHFAPYRIIFFVLGIVAVGPQNWAIRLYKKRIGTWKEPDFDKLITKKLDPKDLKWEDLPYFSSEVPGNRLLRLKKVNPSMVKQVIVPYSKLKYSTRFYDWPPEPQYAKVYACPPPHNDYMFLAGRMNEYWHDTSLTRREQKKQKKKGLKKIAKQTKKGIAKSAQFVDRQVTHDAKMVYKGTKAVVKGTKNVVEGTTHKTSNWIFGSATKKDKQNRIKYE